MPLVLIRFSRPEDLSPYDLRNMETSCKEAWVSMANCSKSPSEERFLAEDVKGVAIQQYVGPKHNLTFVYDNRGTEFYHQLRYRLYQKFETFRPTTEVEVIPIDPNMQFGRRT